MSNLLEKARNIINEKELFPESTDMKNLVKGLKGGFEFGLARKILTKAHNENSDDVWIIQQLALCTYKDDELLPAARFNDALQLLEQIGLRNPDHAFRVNGIPKESLPETLSLGGAVYKRMWEYGGQLEYLYQALAFYQSAWDRDWEIDKGYGGVNAAYIMDVLSQRLKTIALRSGVDPSEAKDAIDLQQKAKILRESMHSKVSELGEKDPGLNEQYWYLVTLAEINFGLRRYDEAGEWLVRTHMVESDEWEKQTTFKQLVALARMQGFQPPSDQVELNEWNPVWNALYKFLGPGTKKALSCYRGKVGLALSGGGFRASFFHLGVLARLAEMDVLRYIEVLSTVSGGSIIGALYYLEIQNLLEGKKDQDIHQEDYIEIVKRIQEHFFTGVKENLRTRTLSNFLANLKMISFSNYSRTHRIGELYEDFLYNRVGKEDKHTKTGRRTMPQLMITPADHKIDDPEKKKTLFKPKFSNWRRCAKVPILLLNSTSLNSGHNWQFTASWMGEPPAALSPDIDINERYRRLWYKQAPRKEHKEYLLGYAVAASACVPGLFEPISIEGLYPGRTVRLVDGGVHDNQGVQGLLNEGCGLILCSDASGQMADQKRPSNSLLGVPLRSNSILMDRVRESEYQELHARLDSCSIHGLFYVHLKKGLQTLPIDWLCCDDPTIPPSKSICTTDYEVDKEIQRRLANIRTDLDSFSEVEAYSLMLSGYLMTEYDFKELDRQHKRDNGLSFDVFKSMNKNAQQKFDSVYGTWGDFNINAPRRDWRFLELEHLIRQPPDSSDERREVLEKHLETGSNTLFKVWKLSPVLRYVAWTLIFITFFLIIFLLKTYWNTLITPRPVTLKTIVITFLLVFSGILIPAFKLLRPEKALRSYILKVIVTICGCIVANIHLQIFDRLFQKLGSLDRLMKLK